MAVRLAADGLYAASLRQEPTAKPVLEFLCFYPSDAVAPEILLERLAKESPVKQKQCAVLLNQGEYQVLALDAMNVPDSELKNAVRWRIKEMVDYSVSEATVDVIRVPGDVNAGGRNQSLIAIVAANKTIKLLQDRFLNLKLPLTTIDIPEMAQRNISSRLEVNGRGLAMLSFEQSGGLLTVTFGGELYLSRRLDITISQIRSADEETQRSVFERISLELQRSLDHFDRQHNYITTAKLVLAPLGEIAESLRDFLGTNMYMPVEILDLSSVVNLDKIPELKSSEQQQRYFEIIGAALRGNGGQA